MGIVDRDQAVPEEIGLMMAGEVESAPAKAN
jgi:hypothetical protein